MAGRLGDWTSSIPNPGRESFLLTWQRRKLETQGSPGTTTRWGKKPVNASLTGSSAAARKPKPGRPEKPEAWVARSHQGSGPRSGAALLLPPKAGDQLRPSGTGGPGSRVGIPVPPLHTLAWVALRDVALQPGPQPRGPVPAPPRPRRPHAFCAGPCGPRGRRSPVSGAALPGRAFSLGPIGFAQPQPCAGALRLPQAYSLTLCETSCPGRDR